MAIQPDDHLQAELLLRCWTSQWAAILVVDCDSGTVVDANPAAEHLTGYDRHELLHLPVFLLHPEAERMDIQEALQVRTIAPLTRRDLHLIRKDGTVFPLEIMATEAFESDGGRVVVVSMRDITDQVLDQHRLAVQNWALQAYSSAAVALGRVRTDVQMMQAVCEAIVAGDSPYDLAWIGLPEQGPGRPVRRAAWAGPASDYLGGLKVSWDPDDPAGKGPTGRCIRTGQPQIMQDSETDPGFAPWRARARKVGLRSSACVAFQVQNGERGTLMVYATRPHAFEPEAIEVFQRLADEIGHALRGLHGARMLELEREQRTRAQASLSAALTATIQALAFTVEKRDPYTAGHQARVATIACAIAGELGWEEDRVEGIRLASLVHGIGKVAVPIEILTKPSRLTPLERELINLHPGNGYAILKDIPFPWPVADIVHQHHERIDGTGYPQGISGEAILPEARLMAVADILESMASFRPYRPALGVGVALAEIEKLSGTWLDPVMVGACVRLFREKGFALPETHRVEAWTGPAKPAPAG